MKTSLNKVLFLLPGPYIYEDRCQTYVRRSSLFSYREPIEEMFSAAILENQGICCKIIHAAPERKCQCHVLNEIKQFLPDAVVISTTYASCHDDLSYASKIKQISRKITTIARGGQMAFIHMPTIMNCFEALDAIIVGEMETVFSRICETGNLFETPGVIFRWQKNINKTIHPTEKQNIKKLPLPARHLLQSKAYQCPGIGTPMATIVASRGCPNKCTFCMAPSVMGNQIRFRPIEHIIDEIQMCKKKFHIADFLMYGDTFTVSREWLIDLCGQIIETTPGIRWVCNARADTLDPQVLSAMKGAGCWGISIGAESASKKSLDRIKKNHSIDDINNAVNLCNENDIISLVYFLIGFPWETKKDILETLNFAKGLNCLIEIFFPYPYPGTALHAEAIGKGLISDVSPPKYPQQTPVFIPHGMTGQELINYRNRARMSNIFNKKAACLLIKQSKTMHLLYRIVGSAISTIYRAYK